MRSVKFPWHEAASGTCDVLYDYTSWNMDLKHRNAKLDG